MQICREVKAVHARNAICAWSTWEADANQLPTVPEHEESDFADLDKNGGRMALRQVRS